MAFFGVALAFKAKSLLLAPFVLLLTVRHRIPWRTYALVPAVHLAYLFFRPQMSFASPGAILVALGVLVNSFAICFLIRRQWLIMTRSGKDQGEPFMRRPFRRHGTSSAQSPVRKVF
jgi:hypothetical protein